MTKQGMVVFTKKMFRRVLFISINVSFSSRVTGRPSRKDAALAQLINESERVRRNGEKKIKEGMYDTREQLLESISMVIEKYYWYRFF